MSRHLNRAARRSVVVAVGWLFADLLLALGILFLISSPPKPKPVPTPTPTPVVIVHPTPTPTPNDRILEHTYCRIQLDIGDPNKFINNDINSARSIVEPQLDRIAFLHDRKVGIAIAYGGTIGGSEEQGTEVAGQMYNVLMALARDKRSQMYTVFRTASLYEPLFTGFESAGTAIVNVYLAARPNNPADTCNAQHHQSRP